MAGRWMRIVRLAGASVSLTSLGIVLWVVPTQSGAEPSAAPAPRPDPRCAYHTIPISGHHPLFQNAPVISSHDGVLKATLLVTYTNPAKVSIGGCPVHLRTYGGTLIGPTLRVKPGDTIEVRLVNDLPPNPPMTSQDMDTPHDFNTTNLHTHGLHVSPTGNSDNVFLAIGPGTDFQYEIKVPTDHPAGTFWYHAHSHGSTALQVSSGMEGALIVEGGLDRVPEIAAAREQVLMFQQIPYDRNGEIESYDKAHSYDKATFGPCSWEALKRPHPVNGQLYPVIQMRPGAVQRWRFIHGGVRETISAQLRGPGPLTTDLAANALGDIITPSNMHNVLKLPIQPLNEVAVDGIALGKIDRWQVDAIVPGQRSDVLVKLTKPGIYYLVDNPSPSQQALTCPTRKERPNLLAEVRVDGPAHNMPLPTGTEIRDSVKRYDHVPPSLITWDSHKPIDPDPPFDPNKPIPPTENPRPILPVDGFQEVSFTVTSHSNGNNFEFLASEHPYGTDHVRTVKLGHVDEWILETKPDSLYYAHPFHIHVNPFQTWRTDQDGHLELIWRDTVLVPMGQPQYIYTQYKDYIGAFVYHCHILDHEDQGMMEEVDVVS